MRLLTIALHFDFDYSSPKHALYGLHFTGDIRE